jgi:hypothetical protein
MLAFHAISRSDDITARFQSYDPIITTLHYLSRFPKGNEEVFQSKISPKSASALNGAAGTLCLRRNRQFDSHYLPNTVSGKVLDARSREKLPMAFGSVPSAKSGLVKQRPTDNKSAAVQFGKSVMIESLSAVDNGNYQIFP